MTRDKKSGLLFLLLLLQVWVQAQEFDWKSKLEPVPENGFYQVALSLAFLSNVQADLSDIRIVDDQNRKVPFLLSEQVFRKGTPFIEFPILKNTTDSSYTTLVIDALEQPGTDHLFLIMGNTAVDRTAILSGSNDQKQWFIINERLLLTNGEGVGSDRFVQSVHFPFVHYRYFKLLIDNRKTDPLPVLRAGIYSHLSEKDSMEWYRIPGITYRITDSSDGASYVWVHHPDLYPVDRVSLDISAPRFFNRALLVYEVSNGKKNALLASETIRSGRGPSIWLPAGKTQDILLVIENGNNPPLSIASVTTHSRKRYLVTYLEKGTEYTLAGGNPQTSFPRYDLAHFRDSIPEQLTVITHGTVLPNEKKMVTRISHNWWIWPLIGLMLLVLGFLTFRLLKDMQQSGT